MNTERTWFVQEQGIQYGQSVCSGRKVGRNWNWFMKGLIWWILLYKKEELLKVLSRKITWSELFLNNPSGSDLEDGLGQIQTGNTGLPLGWVRIVLPKRMMKAKPEQQPECWKKRGDGVKGRKRKLKLLYFKCVNSVLEGNKIMVFLHLPLTSCWWNRTH